jgi:hypothetical protein
MHSAHAFRTKEAWTPHFLVKFNHWELTSHIQSQMHSQITPQFSSSRFVLKIQAKHAIIFKENHNYKWHFLVARIDCKW